MTGIRRVITGPGGRARVADPRRLMADPDPFGHGTVKVALTLHATASAGCLMRLSGESFFALEDTEIRLRPGDGKSVDTQKGRE